MEWPSRAVLHQIAIALSSGLYVRQNVGPRTRQSGTLARRMVGKVATTAAGRSALIAGDLELDRHAFRIDAFRVRSDQGLEVVAGPLVAEHGLPFHRGDTAGASGFERRVS